MNRAIMKKLAESIVNDSFATRHRKSPDVGDLTKRGPEKAPQADCFSFFLLLAPPRKRSTNCEVGRGLIKETIDTN